MGREANDQGEPGRRFKRRDFLRAELAGTFGFLVAGGLWPVNLAGGAPRGVHRRSTGAGGSAVVGLATGDDRYETVLRSLKLVEEDVRRRLGNRRVLVKPNFVSVHRQLAATHVAAIRAILDFFRPFHKGKILVAESPAAGSAATGYRNFGYTDLVSSHNVELVDLDKRPFREIFIVDRNLKPLKLRVSELLLDERIFVVSAAVLKTHDTVVATLSIKNLVMGAPLKHGGINYKPKVHQGIKGINLNLFQMAQLLRPDLSVIDGFEGMEGDGPVNGAPVPSRLAIAGTDPLAVDRIGLDVMGVDIADVGYLTYLARANYGQADRDRIEVRGANVEKIRRKYRLHRNYRRQLRWKA